MVWGVGRIMEEENIKNIERKVNKLLSETKLKIANNQSELGMILIDFANEYNKVWKFTAVINKAKSKPKVVILDDNELSLSRYAEEYPENFKEITDSVHEASP